MILKQWIKQPIESKHAGSVTSPYKTIIPITSILFSPIPEAWLARPKLYICSLYLNKLWIMPGDAALWCSHWFPIYLKLSHRRWPLVTAHNKNSDLVWELTIYANWRYRLVRTLLMKSGAMLGVVLNSPHTCRSLTQQMASRMLAKVWDPVINNVMWGRICLNCRGGGGRKREHTWWTLTTE